MSRSRKNTLKALVFAGIVTQVLLQPCKTDAATNHVTNLNDNGPGSLRFVISSSVSGDTVDFPNLAGTMTLLSSLPPITNSLSILATNVEGITINANGSNQIFSVASGKDVWISGLVLVGSLANISGSALANSGGNVTISNCTIGNCTGQFVIYSAGGTLVLSNCRLAGNNAPFYLSTQCILERSTICDNYCSSVPIIANYGTLRVTNCTVSRNIVAGGNGGALFNGGTMTVVSSTICSNSAATGGGIYNSSTPVQVQNTIIAGNSASGTGPNVSGSVSSLGYNLIGATNGSSGWVANDLVGSTNAALDPLLGPLQNNGGLRFTHALLPGSPAIDAGKSFGLATDQRGEVRPYDVASVSNAPGGDGSDIGAFESGAVTLPANNIALTRVVTNRRGDSGPGSLCEAMKISVSGDAITFAPGLSGTISLLGSLPFLRGDFTFTETNIESITVDGNSTNTMFSFQGGLLSISGLVMYRPGGAGIYGTAISVGEGRGAVKLDSCSILNATVGSFLVFSTASVAMNNCRIAFNTVPMYFSGRTAINNSTIFDNSTSGGAIVLNYSSGMGITNSTLSGNSTFGTGSFGFGGAIYNGGSLSLFSSTICSNSAANGGGIHCVFAAKIQNTLIAGNTASSAAKDVSGPFASLGFNLIGITNNSTGWISGDLVGSANAPLNPQLGPLNLNGGLRPTHALISGSPALDAGISGGLSTDQRGAIRPSDDAAIANSAGGDGSDIGAFELTVDQPPGAPLLSIQRTATNTVVISWPSPSTGFSLIANGDLSTTNWVQVAQIPSDDGVTKRVILPSGSGNLFLRLVK